MKMPELDIAKYLKGEDIVGDQELVFITAGEKSVIPGKDDKPDTATFETTVEFKNGERRLWTMNKTSQRAVATTYGTNTDAWVGKKVIVFVQEQNVRGTMKQVIYARVPAAE